ncbi:b(0,+)-type amino acid transporter 1-like isoform X2 [Dysidea avara]
MALLVWFFAGVLAMGGGLCYSELGTMIKKSGGEFAFLKTAYSFTNETSRHHVVGELISFLFAWTNSLFGKPAASAIVLLTLGEYTMKVFQWYGEISTTSIRLLAIFTLGVLVLLNCYSTRVSAMMGAGLSLVKMIAAVVIIAFGLWYYHNAPETHSVGLFKGTTSNPTKIVFAFYAALWAYDGWNSLSYAAEEVENAEKTLPRAILIGLPIVILVYLLINISFFVVFSIHEMENVASEAIAIPFGYKSMKEIGQVTIPLIVACSTFGAANASIFVIARLNYASAREGMLPKFLASIHTRYKTPVPALLFHATLTALLIFSGGIVDLLNAFSAATWAFYTLCFGGLIIMRFSHPQTPRPFKVWIVIPIVMSICGVVLVILPLTDPADSLYELMALGIVLLGVPVYFVAIQGYWKPPILTKINDQLAVTLDNFLNTTSSIVTETISS